MPVLPDDKSTVCNPHARDPPSCRLQPAAGAIDRPARAPTPCGRARTACQIYAARRAHGPAARRKLADPKGEGTVRAVASGAKTPSTFGLVGFSSRCDPRSGFALGGSSIEYVRTRGRRERPAGAWCLVWAAMEVAKSGGARGEAMGALRAKPHMPRSIKFVSHRIIDVSADEHVLYNKRRYIPSCLWLGVARAGIK